MNTIKNVNWDFNPYYKSAWYRFAGVELEEEKQETFESLWESEWSPEFMEKMHLRLVQGSVRYGKMGHKSHPFNKPRYDRCESIRKRLNKFEETGNAEWLIDIGNEALLMFEEQDHPNFHFEAAGVDAEIHTTIKN